MALLSSLRRLLLFSFCFFTRLLEQLAPRAHWRVWCGAS
jgi:hypothetical protein